MGAGQVFHMHTTPYTNCLGWLESCTPWSGWMPSREWRCECQVQPDAMAGVAFPFPAASGKGFHSPQYLHSSSKGQHHKKIPELWWQNERIVPGPIYPQPAPQQCGLRPAHGDAAIKFFGVIWLRLGEPCSMPQNHQGLSQPAKTPGDKGLGWNYTTEHLTLVEEIKLARFCLGSSAGSAISAWAWSEVPWVSTSMGPTTASSIFQEGYLLHFADIVEDASGSHEPENELRLRNEVEPGGPLAFLWCLKVHSITILKLLS